MELAASPRSRYSPRSMAAGRWWAKASICATQVDRLTQSGKRGFSSASSLKPQPRSSRTPYRWPMKMRWPEDNLASFAVVPWFVS